MPLKTQLVITALAGLLAAILVGAGEYLLHYDTLARYSAGSYKFMQGISDTRSTMGHYLAVFGAALYPVGCYHIYLMLKPANERWSLIAFISGALGFMFGAVWISSRASISALVQLPVTPEIEHLITLYELRYEALLWVIRLTTLAMSCIIIGLSLTGKSHYPRWIALFNPILLLITSFLLFVVAPDVGRHTLPIALNVAFFVFFLLSLVCTTRLNNKTLLQPYSR